MKAVHKFAVSVLSPLFSQLAAARAVATTASSLATSSDAGSGSAPRPPSSAMTSRFHGRVVARSLPKGITGDDETRGKPINRQVDPSTLLPGSGPLLFRPVLPIVESIVDLPRTIHNQDEEKVSLTKKGRTMEDGASSEEWTTLQVFIYASDNGPFSETVYFQLNRKSNEQVEKTLKRMEITLIKKMQKGNKKKRVDTSSVPSESTSCSIWKLDNETMEPDEEWTEALSTANRDFWGLARQTPCMVRLSVNDTILELLVENNPPSILRVQTFDDFESHLYVGVPIVLDLDLLFCDAVEASWFVNETLVQENQRSSTSYTPQSADVGGTLSVVLRPKRASHGGRGSEEAYCFLNKIEVPPENYITSLRPTWTLKRDVASKQNIRVLTYNILADQNAFQAPGVPARFYQSYVDPRILRRQRRLPLILQEILAYNADVLCLQEVDRSVFYGLLEPSMRHLGYEGYFSEKSSDGNQEGCAMFWSLERFESVPEKLRETHNLRDLMSQLQDGVEHHDETWPSDQTVANLFQKRPDLYQVVNERLGHIVQMVPLAPRGLPNHRLWVANTHIFFHPAASHIRTLQMYAICRQFGRNLVHQPGAVVVCGDFNANLTDPAGRILVERHVPANAKYLKLDLNRFSWGMIRRPTSDDDETDFPALQLPKEEHLFPRMRSALSEAAPVTHFIKGFQGTLDHIVVSSSTLEPVGHAPLPSMRDLGRDTAMPSEFLPSDHVSLVAELKFKG